MRSVCAFFYRCFQGAVYLVSWFLPWREPIVFDSGDSLVHMAHDLVGHNHCRVCIVTDEGIVGVGLLQMLLNVLEDVGIECFVYDRTVANPTVDNAQEAAALYREHACTAFVAIGGGSPIDCAKVAAVLIARPGKGVHRFKGILRVLKKLPVLIAIPTTAGTGSEATLAAVVSETDTHEKYAIKDPSLIPYGAVLSAELTVGLPPHITAATGLDALAHAIEAYIGRSNTAKTRRCATEAVSLIFENLPKAFKDGADIEARTNMQRAAYLAGIAFTRAYVGYIHAIGHTLGAFYNIPHGLAIAVTTPHVLSAYGEHAEAKLARLADLIGVASPDAEEGEKAECFIEAVRQLNRSVHIPTGFEQIRPEDIPLLALTACKEGNPEYPVPRIMFRDEFERLFECIRTGGTC